MPEQGTMPEEKNGAAGAEASVPAPVAEASPVPEKGSVPVLKAKAAAAKTMPNRLRSASKGKVLLLDSKKAIHKQRMALKVPDCQTAAS